MTTNERVVIDDGGRADAGFRGSAGDCVVRAVAIGTGLPYKRVYDDLNDLNRGRPGSSRTGLFRKVYDIYLRRLGWDWTPTMGIGTGCTVHLRADELPSGRLIVTCSKHVVAVIDGVVHDTYDSTRDGTRCVYGYYTPPTTRGGTDDG